MINNNKGGIPYVYDGGWFCGVDVFSATIPDLEFQAALHINYAETVLPMKDGLMKLKDFPTDFG